MPWIAAGMIGSAAIGFLGSAASTASSNAANAEIAAAQIAASEAQLATSLAASAALVEAQIGAQYDIFYKSQAAKYDIFNKSMEAQYEIYNATQQAQYQTLLQQFEFQKTSDLTTARAGVRIAEKEANAMKEAARVQMTKNVKAAQIQASFQLDAATIEAAGIEEAADIEWGQAQRNIDNMWMEAVENLRRTAAQQNANRATVRALAGASGGVMREGTSTQIYYKEFSDEMFRQYNWMEGAYLSQKEAAEMTAEENLQYAYKQAGRLIDITESKNAALLESTKIENQAIWEVANIQGKTAIDKANINLEAVEEIYSRDYFTPPPILEYTPTSMPGGGGGGGGGGGHGGGGGGDWGGGGGQTQPESSRTYTVWNEGGGKRWEVSAENINFYAQRKGYMIDNMKSGTYQMMRSGWEGVSFTM